MTTQTILYHTLVAHGRNSGEEFATNFQTNQNRFKVV
jgi:hypothetical protein